MGCCPGKCVLVVDDNEQRLYACRAAIRVLPCIPLVAISYAQAIRVASEHDVACVVLNDHISSFDVATLATEIKSVRSGVEIVVTDGNSDPARLCPLLAATD